MYADSRFIIFLRGKHTVSSGGNLTVFACLRPTALIHSCFHLDDKTRPATHQSDASASLNQAGWQTFSMNCSELPVKNPGIPYKLHDLSYYTGRARGITVLILHRSPRTFRLLSSKIWEPGSD